MIVTASELCMLDLTIESISLGWTIKAKQLDCKPSKFVFVRFPLPRSLWIPRVKRAYGDIQVGEALRDLDIVVVNANHLTEIFRNLSGLSSILRPL